VTCIHGLDENNCPTCRISKSSTPKDLIKNLKVNTDDLRPENPFFSKHLIQKEKIETELEPSKNFLRPNLIHRLPKPNLINDVPDFESHLNIERINEHDLDKYDEYGITKKISLGNPELKLKEEE